MNLQLEDFSKTESFNDNMTFAWEILTGNGNKINFIKLINKCLKQSISVIQIRNIY